MGRVQSDDQTKQSHKEWDYSGETRDRKVISLSLCCHGSETWPAWWDQILIFWKQTFVFLSFWCFYLLYNILIHFACVLLTCTLFCSIGKTHSNLSLRLLKIFVASLLTRNQTQPSVFNCDEIQKLLKNTDWVSDIRLGCETLRTEHSYDLLYHLTDIVTSWEVTEAFRCWSESCRVTGSRQAFRFNG